MLFEQLEYTGFYLLPAVEDDISQLVLAHRLEKSSLSEMVGRTKEDYLCVPFIAQDSKLGTHPGAQGSCPYGSSPTSLLSWAAG